MINYNKTIRRGRTRGRTYRGGERERERSFMHLGGEKESLIQLGGIKLMQLGGRSRTLRRGRGRR
jgi:hypothetical protein